MAFAFRRLLPLALALPWLGSCSEGPGDEPEGPADEAAFSYFFGLNVLAPYDEVWPCASWTLDNEEPLYVTQTELLNQGMYHHSTWLAVPDHFYDGPDGFWDCNERGFNEVEGAVAGTVLIAQSTQSLYEAQEYGSEGSGVVVKIPAHSKIVAQNHMLNVSGREVATGMTMTLHLTHPRNVETILVPFRFAYGDLHIPPAVDGVPTTSAHTMACDAMGGEFEETTEHPFDMRIHFVLPHTHALGEVLAIDILGGPRDGERIVDLQGFNGQGNGVSFDPPIDMSGADGLAMTCQFTNPRDEEIGWGFGDQEMCEFLGMADSDAIMDVGVNFNGDTLVGEQDGVTQFEGPCSILSILPNSKQGPPTQSELDGELYLPPTALEPGSEPVVPECEDFDESTEPYAPIDLGSLRTDLFVGCTWSSCHGASGQAAGLNLEAEDLHGELLTHESLSNPGMPLVDPGDPENSWLMHRVANCEPVNDAGNTLAHMPLGGPTLSDPGLIAKLYAWIEAGAPNN
jgi:hypothetical protein